MIPLDGRGAIWNHHLQMLQLENAERGPLCYTGGQQYCGGKGAGHRAGRQGRVPMPGRCDQEEQT